MNGELYYLLFAMIEDARDRVSDLYGFSREETDHGVKIRSIGVLPDDVDRDSLLIGYDLGLSEVGRWLTELRHLDNDNTKSVESQGLKNRNVSVFENKIKK